MVGRTPALSTTRLEYADQSEAYRNFITSVDSEATKKNYGVALTYFMRFCKLTECSALLRFENTKLEGMLRDYIIHLRQDRKLSPATVASYTAGMTHFFEMNDKILNWKKLKKFKPKFHNIVEDRPYSREEIKKIIDIAPLRDKCIILMMASAGLRRGALPYLRLKDLVRIDRYDLYKINVYKKEQESYTTYCTPECLRYIDQYLDWRKRLGEKLTPNAPLFRKCFDTMTEINRVESITKSVIIKTLKKHLDLTGIRTPTADCRTRNEIMQSHGLRKFFKTACINAGMNPLYSEYVMGHRSGLTKSYFKPSDTELLEGNDKALGYLAAINDLTINEEYRLTTKVTELQSKNDQIMELERQHRKDLEAVQNQMAQMMQMIQYNPKLAHVKPESLLKKSIS